MGHEYGTSSSRSERTIMRCGGGGGDDRVRAKAEYAISVNVRRILLTAPDMIETLD
jgi:hypothetical protein